MDRSSQATASSSRPRKSFARRGKHPNVGIRIARAKAQRFKDMVFGFLSLPGAEFCVPDHGMGEGQVAVQCERMFASGDAFRGAVGVDMDRT